MVGESNDYRSAILLVCSDCNIDQDRMTVIATHELGHALGLAHSPDPESVMYYLGRVRRSPTPATTRSCGCWRVSPPSPPEGETVRYRGW